MNDDLLKQYLAGIDELRAALRGMTRAQMLERPNPAAHLDAGSWNTLEVLCHLADSESLFAERMKRILAEDRPVLPFADPKLFAPALAYRQRDAEIEIGLIELTRKQMASILRTVPPAAMSRCGMHSKDGPVTLEQVLTKAVNHLRHHLKFIAAKRAAMGGPVE